MAGGAHDGVGRRRLQGEVDPAVAEQRHEGIRRLGGDDVGQRLAAAAVRREPGARAGVQIGAQARMRLVQPRSQELEEQAVVAEPAPAPVEADDQRALVLEVPERPPAVVPARERVRQLTADAVDHARPQQELADLRGLQREHLLGQVVADRAVVAGELGEEAIRVGRSDGRHRRQPQACRPALGPRDEPLDL